jgi:hypothetical protein
MLTICTTRLGTDHSSKVWMKLHQSFMRSSPDKFCDRQTDGQTDDGEVIPICRHYSVEGTQKWKDAKKLKECIDQFESYANQIEAEIVS